jgi:uncharacterized protein (TIGR00661 family)
LPPKFNIQKVLIAPLDWGLGHATRCIPIIKALVNNGYTVSIAAEGAQANLLQNEFPNLVILPLKGYRVRYSKSKWALPFRLLWQVPKLLQIIRYERNWLANTIKEHNIDLVISDNRYGLSSKTIPCIFITHQLTIKMPFAWLEKQVQQINYRYINRFTRCWVPDVLGGVTAAGKLSHPASLPNTKIQYTGLLSRFQKRAVGKKYDYCILLSGPEPQRSVLEKKIINSLQEMKGEALFVRGKPESNEELTVPGNITVKNHLPGNELEEAILQSEYIICRSGYTTVMELISLQKKSILVPTPGQTEQEYLADWLQEKQFCISIPQSDFIWDSAIEKTKTFPYQTLSLPIFTDQTLAELLADL